MLCIENNGTELLPPEIEVMIYKCLRVDEGINYSMTCKYYYEFSNEDRRQSLRYKKWMKIGGYANSVLSMLKAMLMAKKKKIDEIKATSKDVLLVIYSDIALDLLSYMQRIDSDVSYLIQQYILRSDFLEDRDDYDTDCLHNIKHIDL
jgi:hypothetical protein